MTPPRPAVRAVAPRRIRILLADSQALDRAGMRALLALHDDCDVVAETASVRETIAQARTLAPDVVVLSLNLPGQERAAAVPALRTALPGLRVVALSERGASHCLVLQPPAQRHLPAAVRCELGTSCLQLAATQGAMATLRRDAPPAQLVDAIRAVAAGRTAFDATTVSPYANDHADRGLLSARELEVGALLAQGRANKEIAAALRISEATTKKHVGSVIAKLGLSDRLQVGIFLARHPQLFDRTPLARHRVRRSP